MNMKGLMSLKRQVPRTGAKRGQNALFLHKRISLSITKHKIIDIMGLNFFNENFFDKINVFKRTGAKHPNRFAYVNVFAVPRRLFFAAQQRIAIT